MALKLSNNAISSLLSAITADSTSIILKSGDGAKFPSLGAGDYFPATLSKSDGSLEIIKVTARSGDTLTATRAQEGTTALSFSAGALIELRLTAATVEDINTWTQSIYVDPATGITTIDGTIIPTSKTLLVSTDIGATVQAYDADLTTLGAGGSSARSFLGLAIGTDVQAYDVDLTTLGAGGAGARSFLGLGTAATTDATAYATAAQGTKADNALTALNPSYTGTLTGGTGVVNLGSGQFYKDASGNVGIGTNSPSSKLQINDANAARIDLVNTNGTTGRASAVNGTFFFGTTTSHPTAFITGDTERMRIDSSGRVGIGTSAPGTKLEVNDNSSAATVPLTIANSIGGVDIATVGVNFNSHGVNFSRIVGGQQGYGSYGNGMLSFYTRGSEIVAERMRIDSGGNLLINTTTAIGKFSLKQGGGDGSGSSIAIQRAGNTNTWEIINGGDDSLYLLWNSASRGAFNPSTGTYYALSDENRKKDFFDSTLGLDAVKQLKPTFYRMKDEEATAPLSLGFVAQEVKSVIPQAYTEQMSPTGEKFIGLQDRPMIAVLTKAIQELNAKVDAQAAEIAQIKATIH